MQEGHIAHSYEPGTKNDIVRKVTNVDDKLSKTALNRGYICVTVTNPEVYHP